MALVKCVPSGNGSRQSRRLFEYGKGRRGRVVLDEPEANCVILGARGREPGSASFIQLAAPRPEWRRRYWLAEPVELPAGSRIEVTTNSPSSYIDLTGARFVKTYPLQAALDFVTAGP